MGKSIRTVAVASLMLALVAGAPVLGDDVVRKGIDAWTTVQGFAQTSFKNDPLPAGFFCEGSQPFTGKIVMKGAPLATEPAKALGEPADTIVARLDDAVFNDKGEAVTRIQLQALSLASLKPLETSCGSYNVAIRLDGEQPTTTMKIFKTEPNGGRYEAPLAISAKVVFTPVSGDVKGIREVKRRVNLGPGTNSVWAFSAKPRYDGPIWIDADGNGKPETQVRGSNFVAGMAPPSQGDVQFATWTTYETKPTCPRGYCPKQSCHCNPNESDWHPDLNGDGCADDHLHCVWVCVPASSLSSGSDTSVIIQQMACPMVAEPYSL